MTASRGAKAPWAAMHDGSSAIDFGGRGGAGRGGRGYSSSHFLVACPCSPCKQHQQIVLRARVPHANSTNRQCCVPVFPMQTAPTDSVACPCSPCKQHQQIVLRARVPHANKQHQLTVLRARVTHAGTNSNKPKCPRQAGEVQETGRVLPSSR